ncbi:MAG: hypothetical protein CVV49_10810 [Spirochaetae bacterium HGW-Spirochaetae-5]|nr:MAG: hypothetical protein CVV49_10810 [Spirochaetae bacterium HGW-Spirochaetae-5]
MNSEILREIDSFVAGTSEVIYLRQEDSLLIIRPDRIQHLNSTGFEMLYSLYEKKAGAAVTVDYINSKYGTAKNVILNDLTGIVKSLSAVMNDDYKSATNISVIDYNPDSIKFPVLSEIAVTYKCQNRCDFCYASSPYRGDDFKEMTVDQIKLIIDKSGMTSLNL